MPILIATIAVLLSGPPGAPGRWSSGWFVIPGGRARTTIYYGPWSCRQTWFDECKVKCSSQGYTSMGCIWIADLKYETEGEVLFVPVAQGGRYAFTHCCCNYPKSTDTRQRREAWDAIRDRFRKEWSKKFGAWPKTSDGASWPGHHVHDLGSSGDPLGEILPVPPDIHKVLNDSYPACYSGQSSWATPGPDMPYVE